jgi:hypothetical protein
MGALLRGRRSHLGVKFATSSYSLVIILIFRSDPVAVETQSRLIQRQQRFGGVRVANEVAVETQSRLIQRR